MARSSTPTPRRSRTPSSPCRQLPRPIHTVVLDLDANDDLDITSSEKLAKLVRDLHHQHSGSASLTSTSPPSTWPAAPGY